MEQLFDILNFGWGISDAPEVLRLLGDCGNRIPLRVGDTSIELLTSKAPDVLRVSMFDVEWDMFLIDTIEQFTYQKGQERVVVQKLGERAQPWVITKTSNVSIKTEILLRAADYSGDIHLAA